LPGVESRQKAVHACKRFEPFLEGVAEFRQRVRLRNCTVGDGTHDTQDIARSVLQFGSQNLLSVRRLAADAKQAEICRDSGE
jgi:hypothetical protein